MTNDKLAATTHGGTVQKWADDAMYKAEPLKASDGPKVYLLWMTPDPLGAIAAMAKMYKGEVVRDLSEVTHAEREEYLAQILKTKLKAPLEAVKLHFMVEGVTRSFTHQMVRQRTAVYAQESLRFAVKEDMAEGVALPPSLMSTDDAYKDHGFQSDEERMRFIWDEAVEETGEAYNKLINMGMPAEDARGLLPHNITTRLNYVTDLRALQDHAGNRLCTQAQFEWRLVFARIAGALRSYNPYESMAKSCNDPELAASLRYVGASENWQYQAIADIFKPVCYLTGKCEFKANFDRACSIRERVDANHAIGRPSTEWDKEHDQTHPPEMLGYHSDLHNEVVIPAIHTREWLMNPGAAR